MEALYTTMIKSFTFIPAATHSGALGLGQHRVRLVNAYTSAFFNRYLKQVESPLLRAAVAEYPEVTFQARQPQQGMATGALASLP